MAREGQWVQVLAGPVGHCQDFDLFKETENHCRILKRDVAYVCWGPPSYPGGIRATEVIAMTPPCERRCGRWPTGGSRGQGTQQQCPLLRKPEAGAGLDRWRGFGKVEPGALTSKGRAWHPREESLLDAGTADEVAKELVGTEAPGQRGP